MKYLLILITALAIWAYSIIRVAAKRQPVPGKDFDERGPY